MHGVVQAALVLRTKAVSSLTEEELHEVLAPKLEGTGNLFRAVSSQPLDFLLLCSSIQSFTADPRQAAYAAACNFLDAFAHSAAERARFPVKVVNLGYSGGGTLDTPAMRRHVESLGFRTLDPASGMESITRLLAGSETQIAVMDRVESIGGVCFSLPSSSCRGAARDELAAVGKLKHTPPLKFRSARLFARLNLKPIFAHA